MPVGMGMTVTVRSIYDSGSSVLVDESNVIASLVDMPSCERERKYEIGGP